VVTDTLVRSSGLQVQGSCQDESVAGMSEESGLAGMCRRRLVGFGNMQYSSQNLTVLALMHAQYPKK
jgi:hypothetical protein